MTDENPKTGPKFPEDYGKLFIPESLDRLQFNEAYAQQPLFILPEPTSQPLHQFACICGSTRFKDEIIEANKRLTLQGYLVLAPGVFIHSGDTISEREKEELDKLHLVKIQVSNLIYVVNVDGYIGDSTKNEIEYAKLLNKRIQYLERPNDA